MVLNRHRFANAKPTKFGRIGHPEAEGNKMFRCGGVIFTDRHTNIRWVLRVYLPTEKTPQLLVWTHSAWTTIRGQTGFEPQTVMLEENVPLDVRTFGYAELVRLRLMGRIQA